MTSDYRENGTDSTWVPTQVARIGDIKTIANRRFVRAGFEPRPVARTKEFQGSQLLKNRDRIEYQSMQWFEPTLAG